MDQEHKANSEYDELSLANEPFLEISCPFLGVLDDPSTPMGFAAPGNQCYALKPVMYVNLERQKGYCLSDCYTDCQYFQQKMLADSEEGANGLLRRIVTGRTLAAGMMLVLILLAVLIWWPPPGTSMIEGTVFGRSSTSLNSPNAGNEAVNSAEQPSISQAESEVIDSIPAASSSESLEEAQAAVPNAESEEKVSKSKELNTGQSSAQGAALNPSSIDEASVNDEAENLLEEPNSPPEVQDISPEPEEAVEQASIPEMAGSDRPGQGRVDQSSVVVTKEGVRDQDAFSPIAYGEQESDAEILNIYEDPGSENYVRIARPELFNLMGRDETGEWIKISTESDIEGWVRVSDTGLGSWIIKLPQIGP